MPIDRQRNQKLFQRMSRLLKQVADKPQPETVHHLRTTARRIEALVQALAPEPGRNERKLLQRLGLVRRRAGKLRDMDVQMSLLRGLKIERDAQQKERLLERFSDLRGQREKKLLDSLDKETVRQFRKRLQKTATNLSLFAEPAPPGGSPGAALPFDPVAASLQMFSRVAREQGALREENLHAYRVETKQARYVAEMAGADRRGQKVVAELKRMQDAVGEWHDWLELNQRAKELLKPRPESALMSALENIQRAKFREAIAVCTDVRRVVLEMGTGVVPPRKSAVGVGSAAMAVTA